MLPQTIFLDLPEDTEESLKFTYSFAEETNSEMVNFYSAMAYPGSPFISRCKKMG